MKNKQIIKTVIMAKEQSRKYVQLRMREKTGTCSGFHVPMLKCSLTADKIYFIIYLSYFIFTLNDSADSKH